MYTQLQRNPPNFSKNFIETSKYFETELKTFYEQLHTYLHFKNRS